MTARDHTPLPLLHRLAALFALLAFTAAAFVGAEAAWPPAEGEPVSDAAIPFSAPDGDERKLLDIATDNRAHRAVAVANNRRAFLLGPPGHSMDEIELPGRPNTVAIDPTRNLALIGADQRHGVLFLDLDGRTLHPETARTGRDVDALAVAPAQGIAVALERKRDTLHLIDLERRETVDSLRLRRAKLVDVAVHTGRGHAYLINQHAQERRARGGRPDRGGDDDDEEEEGRGDRDRDDDRDDRDDRDDHDRGDDDDDDRDDDRDEDDRDDRGLQGELITLDLTTRQILTRTPLSRHADTLVIDEALNLAAVSLGARKKVQLIDLATGHVVQEHTLPHKIEALALHPTLHQLLITLGDADQVALLDIESATLVAPYAGISEPRRAAVSSRHNLALVISGEAHNVLELLPLPAPAPTLTALAPADAILGDPALENGLDLTVTGGPFFDGASLHFGDHRYTARWHAFDRLTTHLPPERFTDPAEIPVRVENPHPSAGPSAPLTFTLIEPNPVPVLNAVTPAVIELTDPPSAATVTLSGEGFILDTVAHLGAHPLATTLLSETTLSVTLPAELLVDPGEAVITLFNPAPGGGTSAPATIQLESPGPRIDAFAPAEGPAGTLVTITGRNFDALTPANNVVRFSGLTSGGSTPAAIAYADAETLRVVVPLDAESGPITLTTADGEAVTNDPFTLQPLEAFDIQAAPATTTLAPGGQAYVMIELASLGLSEYRRPVTLTADGLPSGITAAFTEGSLTLRRPATLILTADPGAAPGEYSFTITATGREGQQQRNKTVQLSATLLAPDVTTVVGRVLRAADDQPMAGVGIQLGETYTYTDAAGFYRFVDPVITGDQVILIDGGTANTADLHYPSRIAMPVMIEPGRENPALTSFLAPIDVTRKATVTPGAATDVTFDELPNYALRIPEGATIMGWDGTPVTEINVRTTSPDRLPIRPLPDGITSTSVYLYYFFRPGGAEPSEPIPVTMANEAGLPPGTKVDMWYYDESIVPNPASNQWRIMGQGTVSEDGLSVISDPGVGIPKFCCGATTLALPDYDPTPDPCGPKRGNPVDLATGTGSVMDDHSLGINGLLPARISCGFGSTSPRPGPLGVGTWLNTEWQLTVGGGGTLGLTSPQGAFYVLGEDAPGRFTMLPGNRGEATGVTARYNGSSSAIAYVDFPGGTTFEFDMGGANIVPLARVTDPSGNHITITRDPNNRPIAVTDGAGRPYVIEYNEHGYIGAITDPAGRTQRYHYIDYLYSVLGPTVHEITDDMLTGTMVLSSVEDFSGRHTHYRWNRDFGKNFQKHNGNGKPVFSVYDDEGRITDQFYGGVTYRRVTSSPCLADELDILLVSDPAERELPYGLKTTHSGWGYCGMGGTAAGGSGGGSYTFTPIPIYSEPVVVHEGHHKFDYLTIGKRIVETTHTDPNGNRTKFRFDGRKKNTRVVDALGRITTNEYLPTNDRLRSTTDPIGRSTYYTYDARGNRTSVHDPAGHITQALYDPLTSLPEQITDALGRETVLEYDELGRLIRATNAAGESAEIGYTDRGQIETISDPAGNRWTLAYDEFGNLTALSDPEGNTNRYRYDAASRVIEAIDPLGRSTRYAYDPMDRVTQVINPKGETTTLSYTEVGRLATVTDAKGAVIESNAYDTLGRLATRTDALGQSEQFTYDLNDNLTTYTDAAGQVTTFGYDALDRLVGMVDAGGRSTQYEYDLAGNLVWVSDSLTGDSRYDYDELDRLVRETSPQGQVEYAYDAASQLVRRTVNGLSNTHYRYDLAGRVTEIDHDGRIATYRYDAAGRMSEKALPNGITQRYGYSAAGDLLSIAYVDASGMEVDRIDYEYDAAGNRTRRNRARTDSTPESLFNAVYDDANRMLSYNGYPLSYDATGNLISRETEQGVVSYSWDARGQLVGISGPNGSASFRYDHQGRRIEKTVNGVTTGYLYDGAQAIAELAGSALGATYHTGLMIDEVLGRYSAVGDRQLLSDALGSVVGTADEGGWVTGEYAYSPFGESVRSTEGDSNPLGYTGREEDGTGLYYYRARYYDPGLKRFISPDPIGLLDGVNVYAYTHNTPTSHIDPTGMNSLYTKLLEKLAEKAREKFFDFLGKETHKGNIDELNKNIIRDHLEKQYHQDLEQGMDPRKAIKKYSDDMRRVQTHTPPGMLSLEFWEDIYEQIKKNLFPEETPKELNALPLPIQRRPC